MSNTDCEPLAGSGHTEDNGPMTSVVEPPSVSVRANSDTGTNRDYDSLDEVPADKPRLRLFALQMARVGRRLYVSGFNGVSSAKVLQSLHVTHVLNMAVELEDLQIPPSVSVRWVGLRDNEDEDLQQWLPKLVEYMHDVISGGGRVVVNCVAGVSRSVSVCLAYKVAHEGQSLRQAWVEVIAARPMAMPNLGFWRQLVVWEKRCRGESSVTLLPYISGLTPDLELYRQHTETRISLAYMEDLLTMFSLHLLLLFFDLFNIVWPR